HSDVAFVVDTEVAEAPARHIVEPLSVLGRPERLVCDLGLVHGDRALGHRLCSCRTTGTVEGCKFNVHDGGGTDAVVIHGGPGGRHSGPDPPDPAPPDGLVRLGWLADFGRPGRRGPVPVHCAALPL